MRGWVFGVLLASWVTGLQAYPGDAIYARPGQRVDMGGRALNFYCSGQGSPTAILESGLGGRASAWAQIQPDLSRTTRVCSYDRAGYAYSDPGPEPRTSQRIASDLYAALRRSGESGPFLLIGATFGTFDLRLLAAAHSDEIAGILLLNPSPEDEELVPASPTVARIDQEGLDHAIACRDAAKRGVASSECVPGPNPQMSDALNRARTAMLRKPETWAALVSEWRSIRESAAEVKASRGTRLAFPLMIVSAGKEDTFEGSDTDKKALHAAWLAWTTWQDGMKALSSDSLLWRAGTGSRALESTDPALVVAAARQLIAAVRKHARLSR